MKYLIKVIPQAEDADVGNVAQEGFECDGFVIIGNKQDCSTVYIHDVNQMDMAMAIAGNTELRSASIIAKALKEALDMANEEKKKDMANTLMKKVLGIKDDDNDE